MESHQEDDPWWPPSTGCMPNCTNVRGRSLELFGVVAKSEKSWSEGLRRNNGDTPEMIAVPGLRDGLDFIVSLMFGLP